MLGNRELVPDREHDNLSWGQDRNPERAEYQQIHYLNSSQKLSIHVLVWENPSVEKYLFVLMGVNSQNI